MKIEPKPSPISNQIEPMPPQKVDRNLNTTKTKPENRVTRQSTQKRILNWFTQAGVQEEDDTLKSSIRNEKVKRKNEILAHKKLRNLENILSRALDFCLDDGKEEDLDPDWFFSFVKMAEEIYSPAMQELWGKIFAVETARPGSFSLKTLGILKQLTQKDAQIFRHAVNLTSRAERRIHA